MIAELQYCPLLNNELMTQVSANTENIADQVKHLFDYNLNIYI